MNEKDKVSKAAAELSVIRALMERPVRCTTMSGLSGVIAGCAALAGLTADSLICGYTGRHEALWLNLLVWGSVFIVAMAGSIGLTARRERRRGSPFWSPARIKILWTIVPPFVAGVGLTAAIVYRWYWDIGPNQFGLIAPIWMLFYGLACWQVAEFSIAELRVLGAAFIASGLLAATFFQANIPYCTPGTAPYWTLGVTFGGFHIIYGLWVWKRYGG